MAFFQLPILMHFLVPPLPGRPVNVLPTGADGAGSTPRPRSIQVGEFAVATGGGVWVAIGERFGALCFSAEVAQKLRDRHAVLELDLVAGHQDSPSSGELRLRPQWLTGRAC